MRNVLPILLLLAMRCAEAPPLVIVASVDGPRAWANGFLVGDGRAWALLAHSDHAADLMAGVHEGFSTPWDYGPPGGLRGQGSLLTLAAREGWVTAVFAAPSDSMRPYACHLASCAATSMFYPSDVRSLAALTHDLRVWASLHRAPRFAVVHLSLDDLPHGQPGAQALVGFWNDLDEMLRPGRQRASLLAIYLPNPVEANGPGLLRVGGAVPGAALPPDMHLSTLDVAPTIAATLDLHYTPDYPGQSLAAFHAAGRTDPLPFIRGSCAMVMGTRWMVCAQAFEDTVLPLNVRFFDLWSGRFSSRGVVDASALALLDFLPSRSEAIP